MDEEVPASSTPEPVLRLLELGKPQYARDLSWPDYSSFGILSEHIPYLIRLATDQNLLHLTDENEARAWGPIHAWRALGQLHAAAAIIPLMKLFHEVRDDDWVIEEMPTVFTLIGPPAFPYLEQYLRDEGYPPYSRLVAATSLTHLAIAYPALRDGAVQVLTDQLIGFEQNSPGMNSVLIANLVDLNAVEQANLIQKAFTESRVDRFIVGDWADIKRRLDIE